MEQFTLEAEAMGPHAIVVVGGEIDAYTAPALREKFLELINSGIDRLVVDLRKVTFIESVGLGTLVAARKRLRRSDRNICIVLDEGQGSIYRTFEITGLTKVFPIHRTVEAAVEDCLDESAA